MSRPGHREDFTRRQGPSTAPGAAEEPVSQLSLSEAQVILAEKRTSLATLRTGIAIFALPLSVMSVLIATSKYYDVLQVLHLLIPLLLMCALLVALALYLVFRSISRLRHYDHLILALKQKEKNLSEFL